MAYIIVQYDEERLQDRKCSQTSGNRMIFHENRK